MNRLAHQSSPYLRQHANNPVHWYPWGQDAFKLAQERDCPILLSVGYSACHWCHVMAHESFEDLATANVMNELFVNVKVDREERPDVDAIYMEAVQAISGQGGWPMTVFLTPDGRPFFAGTYYPPQAQAGRPGFVDLLHSVHEAWTTDRADLETQADELRTAIATRTQIDTQDPISSPQDWVNNCINELQNAHDKQWGGFGAAPKFPQTAALEVLLRSGDSTSLNVVTTTLDAMASGGMYDHIGGGFSRYSVDAFWMVPHFEKMLYDQALLLRTYVQVAQVTGEQRYRQVAEEIANYVLRDLRSADGGFHSAEDADSEGEEGRFYIWRPEQIDVAVDHAALAAAAKNWYGVTKAGNFEGSNILHRPVRGDLLRPEDVETARLRLFTAREKRVRPALDDKVLTEWNAMFIAALSQSAGALQQPQWLASAVEAADFLLGNLRRADGRWLRSWHSRNSQHSQPQHSQSGAPNLAFANDYAWLVEAFTRLGEATGQARWRQLASETADAMLELFWDEEQGGLFTTGADAEQLVVRAKDLFDGATPSANSTAAMALARLSTLSGNPKYRQHAQRIVALLAAPLAHHPTALTHLLAAVEFLNGRTELSIPGRSMPELEIVIAGDYPELVTLAQQHFNPNAVLLWGQRDNSPLWEGRTNGAYVCRNQVCGLPSLTPAELAAQLSAR